MRPRWNVAQSMQHAPAAASLTFAAEHTFERVSVARDYDLQTEALRHGRGRIELAELKGAMLAEVASGSMLTARGEIATKETLEPRRAHDRGRQRRTPAISAFRQRSGIRCFGSDAARTKRGSSHNSG